MSANEWRHCWGICPLYRGFKSSRSISGATVGPELNRCLLVSWYIAYPRNSIPRIYMHRNDKMMNSNFHP